MACTQGLDPRQGVESRPPTLGEQSLTHWTTSEVPLILFLLKYFSESQQLTKVSVMRFKSYLSGPLQFLLSPFLPSLFFARTELCAVLHKYQDISNYSFFMFLYSFIPSSTLQLNNIISSDTDHVSSPAENKTLL